MQTTDLETTTTAGLIVPRNFSDVQELAQVLDAAHVPYQDWGRVGHTRSLEELFAYQRDHRVTFSDSLPITIEVQAAVAIVQFTDASSQGLLLELIEDRQITTKTGAKIQRNLRGIGKTLLKSERAFDAMVRGLREELGFSDPQDYDLRYKFIEDRDPMPSEKWPGIFSADRRILFECKISEKIFRRAGYVAHKDGRETHLIWTNV